MQRINADFSQRVVLHADDIEWQESPMKGVHRRPLDRVGDEVARATTIVRYAAGSHFSPHVHHGGEEFLVLEGVFQDEHGDYPAGSYLRNPPGTSHTPGSEPGCIIFVKLWQFEPDDDVDVRLHTDDMTFEAVSSGVSRTLLFRNQLEEVSIYKLDASTELTIDNQSGLELLVLEGDLRQSDDLLQKGSWLRMPVKEITNLVSAEGATFWFKTGNLGAVPAQLDRINTFQA